MLLSIYLISRKEEQNLSKKIMICPQSFNAFHFHIQQCYQHRNNLFKSNSLIEWNPVRLTSFHKHSSIPRRIPTAGNKAVSVDLSISWPDENGSVAPTVATSSVYHWVLSLFSSLWNYIYSIELLFILLFNISGFPLVVLRLGSFSRLVISLLVVFSVFAVFLIYHLSFNNRWNWNGMV